eukprot:SM000008S22197  [mRNA]  locus=s8:339945:341302:- [translate_table: standard]
MRCKAHGKHIDGLHAQAGSADVVELHGSLWKTRCTGCGENLENRDMPTCPALAGRGAPHQQAQDAQIELPDLPRCTRQLQDSRLQCRGLLRPHVVWFGENLDPTVSEQAYDAAWQSDNFIIVGTSAVPAAGYAKVAYMGGATLAEFNIEDTPISSSCTLFVDLLQTCCPKSLASLHSTRHRHTLAFSVQVGHHDTHT